MDGIKGYLKNQQTYRTEEKYYSQPKFSFTVDLNLNVQDRYMAM